LIEINELSLKLKELRGNRKIHYDANEALKSKIDELSKMVGGDHKIGF